MANGTVTGGKRSGWDHHHQWNIGQWFRGWLPLMLALLGWVYQLGYQSSAISTNSRDIKRHDELVYHPGVKSLIDEEVNKLRQEQLVQNAQILEALSDIRADVRAVRNGG